MVYFAKKSRAFRLVSALVAFSFLFSSVVSPSYAQSILNLPAPGTMVTPSSAFVPLLLTGMTLHPENPLKFDFILDSGNTDFTENEIRKESARLVKYFLASMTIPKNDLWVNLSPYEKERIIPDELGKTELGRDLLAQDYLLKQLTASFMYPEDELGQEFWDRVYKKAQDQFGTTDIPVNTFNKVWVLPESATVYENEQTVYVVQSRLKVMLDSDYVAMSDGVESTKSDAMMELGESIIREIIIPEIEKEVNSGQSFAPLRQIYHSLILAKWYKETITESLLARIYVDQNKTAGVNLEDGSYKEDIYAKYIAAYKKGVFNLIKEDYDAFSQKAIPRKYFSGGFKNADIDLEKTDSAMLVEKSVVGHNFRLAMEVAPQKDGKIILGDSKTIAPLFKDNAVSAENAGKELLENNEITIKANDGAEYVFKLQVTEDDWYIINVEQSGRNIGHFDFNLGFAANPYDEYVVDSYGIEVNSAHKGVGRALASLALAISRQKGEKVFKGMQSVADKFWNSLGFKFVDKDTMVFDLVEQTIPDINIQNKETERRISNAVLFDEPYHFENYKDILKKAEQVASRHPGSWVDEIKEGQTTRLRVLSPNEGRILFDYFEYYNGIRDADKDVTRKNGDFEKARKAAQKIATVHSGATVITEFREDPAAVAGNPTDRRKRLLVIEEIKGAGDFVQTMMVSDTKTISADEIIADFISSLKILNGKVDKNLTSLGADFADDQLGQIKDAVEAIKKSLAEIGTRSELANDIRMAVSDVFMHKFIGVFILLDKGIGIEELPRLARRFQDFREQFDDFVLIVERGELANIALYHESNRFNLEQLPPKGLSSSPISEEVGGIDFHEIDVERQGDGVNIHFLSSDIESLIHMGIDGVVPVIINLTPINSVLPFLGLDMEDELGPADMQDELAYSMN